MLVVRLLEMPLTELEQSVTAEIDDNPALETCDPDDMSPANDSRNDTADTTDDEDFETATEREERESALDDALAGIGMDDEMPATVYPQAADSSTAE